MIVYIWGLSQWFSGKESACDAGDMCLIPGLGRSPGRGHGNPLQYSCLEKPHGQRSLAGYSPWGRRELDTTERLSTAQVSLQGLSVWGNRKKKSVAPTHPLLPDPLGPQGVAGVIDGDEERAPRVVASTCFCSLAFLE